MLRTVFVVTILCIGLVAAVRSRFGALLLYVWFAMFRPLEWLYIDLSSLRLSLVIALLLLVPCLVTGVFPNVTHLLSLGALAMLGLSLVAQIEAPRPDVGWFWFDYFWRVVIVALLATSLITTRRRLTLMMTVIAGAWAMHAGKAGLMAAIAGGASYAEGLAGAFSDRNDYALGIVMAIPLMIGAAQNLDTTKTVERWLSRALFISVPFSALTVISTMSRGGFLALVAFGLVFLGLQKRRFLAFSVVGVVLLVGLPFIPLPEGYTDRLSTIRTYEEVGETSAISRIHFWQVAVRMVTENPLGVGLKNYEVAYDRYDWTGGEFGHSRAVHSSHFQVLAELGYVGALVWIGMFGFSLLLLIRMRRRFMKPDAAEPAVARFYVTMSVALISSIVSFMVGGAFAALMLNDMTWLCFALVAALDRLAQKEGVAATPAFAPFDVVARPRDPRPPRVAASF